MFNVFFKSILKRKKPGMRRKKISETCVGKETKPDIIRNQKEKRGCACANKIKCESPFCDYTKKVHL